MKPRRTSIQLAYIILLTIAMLAAVIFGYSFVLETERNNGQSDIPESIIPDMESSSKNNNALAPQFGIAAGGGLIFMDQEKLNQYFDELAIIGVSWIRFDIDWHIIQALDPDTFDWSGTDRVVETAERYGIEILGTLAYTPSWAVHPNCDNGFGCPPSDTADFARFVRLAVYKYHNSIDYWEIWNEPNSDSYWGRNSTVEQYADILEASFTEIKSIDPQAIVMVGGLAITGESESSPSEYMKELYESGAKKYFDAIAVHPYTYPFSVDSSESWNGWLEIEKIHQLAIREGDVDKKIWITEFGAPTNGPGSQNELDAPGFIHHYDFMSEPAQAELLETSVLLYKGQSSYMGPYFWYSLVDRGSTKDSTENFFGLIDYYGNEKESFSVFSEAIR